MRFVIITAARSGSTHLVHLLSSHRDIVCHSEVFGRNRVLFRGWNQPGKADIGKRLLQLRNANVDKFIERIFTMDAGRAHVGFKIFEDHGAEIVRKIAKDASIAKIILYRENMLSAYASSLVSKKTGVWGSLKRRNAAEKPKVEFKPGDFLRFHDRRALFYRRTVEAIAKSNQKVHLIRYDEINEWASFASLLSFIGADLRKFKFPKTTTRRPATNVVERFDNPDEVASFLKIRGLLGWTHEQDVLIDEIGAD